MNWKEVATTAIVTIGIICLIALGALSNAHADDARTQMESACVKAHGSWNSDNMECRR